jgi:hypothetical protein
MTEWVVEKERSVIEAALAAAETAEERTRMNALLAIVEFANPRHSTVAAALMTTCRWLLAKGRLKNAGNINRYIFYKATGELLPRGGLAITDNFVEASFLRSLTPQLPSGRAHGTVRTINQPILILPPQHNDNIDDDEETNIDNNDDEVQIVADACCEIRRREYVRGLPCGPSLCIHTCEHGTFVKEVMWTQYDELDDQTTAIRRACRVSRSDPEATTVYVEVIAIDADAQSSRKTMALPIPVSDAWLALGDDGAHAAHLCSTYLLADAANAARRLLDGVSPAVLASLPSGSWPI